MANKDKYRKTELSDFFDYTEGNLEGQDRNAFERKMEKDPFEAEAAEGLSMISREEAIADLLEIKKRIKRRGNRRKRIGWYSAAASFAALMIVGTAFFNLIDLDLREKGAWEKEAEELRSESPVEQSTKEKSTEAMKSLGTEETESRQNPVERVHELSPSETPSVQNNTPTSKKIIEKMNDEAVEDMVIEDEAIEDAVIDDEAIENPAERAHELSPTEYAEEETPSLHGNMPASEKNPMRVQKIEPSNVSNMELGTGSSIQEKKEMMVSQSDKSKKSSIRKVRSAAAPRSVEQNALVDVEDTAGADVHRGFVSGVLIDAEDNKPLPGASVVVKGTRIGTVTDMDGNFELELGEGEGNTVVASFIGMESKEVVVSESGKVTIVMEPSTESLDEVVVTGYGVQRQALPLGTSQRVEVIEDIEYKSAYPLGGMLKYKRMMDSVLVFPEIDFEDDKVVVVLKFNIRTDGKPYGFEVLKSPAEEFSDEAIRLVESGPNWVPATKDGEYYLEAVRLRVVFRR